MKIGFLPFLSLLFLTIACTSGKGGPPRYSVNVVKIGNQIWTTKNLNVERFRNGDYIPHAKTVEDWEEAGKKEQPAWCYFNNDSTKASKYGKLYNWYAVNDPRGLAPEGYHIPTDEEWTTLCDFLGGEQVAGKKLKGKVGWKIYCNGNNESGFDGIPGGYRYFFGSFKNFGTNAYYWSASENFDEGAWCRYLSGYKDILYKEYHLKEKGLSVRCVKD